ncbi:MAG TPA: alpha/beta hydrolase-fold protein, partial [Salinisphaeraceae bacterium]|nr:alpha/beta hydrolase-fold protein [Salinisphaeraceae bacterium]
TWQAYDASAILAAATDASRLPPIRVEQGLADGFLEEQLQPERLEQAAQAVGAEVSVQRREGYDHSYFFIASFMDEQLAFVAKHL